jgi:ATP-dependent DNA helicase RecG
VADLKHDLVDIVRALIQGGESFYVEFKTAWAYGSEGKSARDRKDVARDIGEAVVAFANADGGDLLIGVEDSGDVTGLPDDWTDDKLRYLLTAHKSQVKGQVSVDVHDVLFEGRRVLLFRVRDPSPEVVVTADGRCMVRRGNTSQPELPDEITKRRQQHRGDGRYEAEPVPAASLDDIDIPDALLAMSPHLRGLADKRALLRYWNLVEGRNGTVVLKRAALLLFATEPLRWHPNSRIRLQRVVSGQEGTGPRLGTRETEILGPIASMLPKVISTLKGELEVEARLSDIFSVTHVLPIDAVTECVVNAVAHRNYAVEGNAIEIVFHPNHVEFKSPGNLPEPLTVDDLRQRRGVHRARNPLLMRVLRDLGWTRDQGEGMRRIFEAMAQVELHEPELEVRSDTFFVRLQTRSIHDEDTQAWLSAYGPYGLRPDQRKYLIAIREGGGAESIDKLARRFGASFDDTKKHLVELERQGFVWHAPKSRSYHLVDPLVVAHERAYKLFISAGFPVDAATRIDRTELHALTGSSAPHAIDRLRESGIVTPVGKGTWKLGESLLKYAETRGA